MVIAIQLVVVYYLTYYYQLLPTCAGTGIKGI